MGLSARNEREQDLQPPLRKPKQVVNDAAAARMATFLRDARVAPIPPLPGAMPRDASKG